jgi:hypothetical protein
VVVEVGASVALADIAIYLSFYPKLAWDAEESFSGTRLIIKAKGKREKAKVKKPAEDGQLKGR